MRLYRYNLRRLRNLRSLCSSKVPGHLYLIKEREFVKTNEPIYKIGKSKSIRHRMPAYPKDSRLLVMMYFTDIDTTEKKLIQHFDETFFRRTDVGREYYEALDDQSIMSRFIGFLTDFSDRHHHEK